ncbi:hypothetical protein RI129_003925 [Pyrocoelia pectoralis]|uniref:Flavin-containing monooxygenase n=1 Tax=Pyrocoelia pectoralis TaxID=417401 RepID=A0AAN7VTB5_9COLE
MRIAIIGAGISGLLSLKYAKESGHECHVFEQTGELGGTWVYTEKYGTDENGMPITQRMYKDLVTNTPKEIMILPDYQYPSHIENSYITQPEVLEYIRGFANKFDLERHIHYYAYVTKVEPSGEQWIVTVMDVKAKEELPACYDAVFVCNGAYLHPRMPEIEGQDLFKGLQISSRDYRNPDLYKSKRVLIVGGSFSAVDIANQITAVAEKVYISHWGSLLQKVTNVTLKPGVSQLYNDGAVFVDGSKEDFDIILYCTGYERVFPFLTKECGITVEDNWVQYLYKHTISIEKPTLYFIGVPHYIGAFINSNLQARFSVAALDGKFSLPSKEEMRKEIDDNVNELRNRNVPQRHFHNIGLGLREYMADLCRTAGIRPFPEVITRLHDHLIHTVSTMQKNAKYVIVDDEQFLKLNN